MKITTERNETKLTVKLEGWLDTLTSPELDKVLVAELDTVTDIVFDFTDLEYVSSAGLRVLLCTQKTMKSKGSMVIMHANNDIKEMFEFTGFIDVLTLVD